MRNLKPSWPRWIAVLSLGILVWWGVDQIQPQIDVLEQRSCERLAGEVLAEARSDLQKKAALTGTGDEQRLHVQRLAATDQISGCQKAVEDKLKPFVTIDANSPISVLWIESFREHDDIIINLEVVEGEGESRKEVFSKNDRIHIPDGTSLYPPLLAVFLALLLRNILFSLFAAIFVGAMFLEAAAPWSATVRTADNYLFQTIIDPSNLYILGFTLVLVGTIHVCIAMGGMQGIVNLLNRRAKSVRSTQISTALMGLAVFFDDYANAVVVGSAARPMTDAKRISREKLAYLVDSTAAPVAGIAVISTWIGFEIGLFDKLSDKTGTNGYDFFFEILPYRFYCIFALIMVFLIAWMGRDFGPMLKAERRARRFGRVAPGDPEKTGLGRLTETQLKKGVPARALNGILPIVSVILGTFIAFVVEGSSNVVGFQWSSPGDWANAFVKVENNLPILFGASVAGLSVALILAFSQKLLTVREAVKAWTRGARAMLPALAILVLAIGIRQVTIDMGTDRFLVALLSDVDVWMVPLTTFLLAAAVAFATGTSWGTMGILLPVAVPLAFSLSGGDTAGVDDASVHLMVVLVGAAVLDGAIFGDHCSLISDTTVMSSMASSCDHVEHVRTQIPYAIVAMLAAAGAGYLLIARPDWDGPTWISYALGITFMFLVVRFVGRKVDDNVSARNESSSPT
jgi:Na+/H+ antiporter NhaC